MFIAESQSIYLEDHGEYERAIQWSIWQICPEACAEFSRCR